MNKETENTLRILFEKNIKRYKEGRSINIRVEGHEGSGKTHLIMNIIDFFKKELCKDFEIEDLFFNAKDFINDIDKKETKIRYLKNIRYLGEKDLVDCLYSEDMYNKNNINIIEDDNYYFKDKSFILEDVWTDISVKTQVGENGVFKRGLFKAEDPRIFSYRSKIMRFKECNNEELIRKIYNKEKKEILRGMKK